jgi:hypothetical protein
MFFSLNARRATAAHQHDKPGCIIRATLIDVRNDLPYDILELTDYVVAAIARALIAACNSGTGNAGSRCSLYVRGSVADLNKIGWGNR